MVERKGSRDVLVFISFGGDRGMEGEEEREVKRKRKEKKREGNRERKIT